MERLNQMTKSIEEQADEFTSKAFLEIEEIQHRTGVNFFADEAIQLIIKDTYLNAAKARDVQWQAVVNGLETLYYNNPNVRQDAYNQGVRDCIARLTKADQMLKEMGIK